MIPPLPPQILRLQRGEPDENMAISLYRFWREQKCSFDELLQLPLSTFITYIELANNDAKEVNKKNG